MPKQNIITCLEIARPDILDAILDRGFRVDMLSDPCDGAAGDLSIYRAAKALNVPLIIHAPPKLNMKNFKIRSSPYEHKSFQDQAVLYMKRMISKAKQIGLHE